MRGHGLLARALHAVCDPFESADPEIVFYGEGGRSYRKFECKRVYVAVENRYPDFAECDYALSFLAIRDRRNLRVPMYVFDTDASGLLRVPGGAARTLAEERGFCSFVVSNGGRRASRRIEFFRRLNERKPVASGGRVLNNVGRLVEDKLAFLRQYKFHIAFENHSHPGYTTEKLPHAMMTRSIGIYWGNPDIHREFNPKSFINAHDFPSEEALLEHVLEVDRNPDLYRAYLEEPCFHNNQPNEWYSLERLAGFLSGIVAAPRTERPWVCLPSRLFSLKRRLMGRFSR